MTAQNSEKITYWQSTDSTQLWDLSKAIADSVATRLAALRTRVKHWNNTPIGPSTGSVILDTGVVATPFTDLQHLVEAEATIVVSTLAAGQSIGVLMRIWSDAGAELRRAEASSGVYSAATSGISLPIMCRYTFGAGVNYRVTVDLVRRGGAGNISAPNASLTTITDQPVVFVP